VKRSNRLVIFVGVLLAILAFVGIVIVLNNGGGGGTGGQNTPPPTTAVLVAKVDIAIGDPVTPDKVEVQQVAPKDVVGTPMGSTTQVSGQPALFAVPKGSQISEEVIGTGGGGINIAGMLKPGEKAIAFQVDPVTGLNFLITPGDYVDIVLSQSITVLQPTQDTATKPAGQQRFETIPGLQGVRTVKAILQDKRVLYVSQSRQSVAAAQASASPGAGGQTQQAQPNLQNVIIIIAGTDQDAEVIKFAQDNVSEVGPLTAVLRNASDTDTEQTTGITIDQLVAKYGLRIPNIVQRLQASPAP
jgi:Flp pilus assembly protein CpaB